MKVILVGGKGGTHIADSLLDACVTLGIDGELVDTAEASKGPRWIRRVHWHLLGHRPPHLEAFSRALLARCRAVRPDFVITTGTSPVRAAELRKLQGIGVRTINFSTDDPWSGNHRSSWFLEALPVYQAVFSPRRANLEDLVRLGCRAVRYLPFAYDPRHCRPYEFHSVTEAKGYASDVLFVGGADDDRVPFISALIRAGAQVRLYGAHWDRFRVTRPVAYGFADPLCLRKATCAAKIVLCLVRRANRDGHVMRSFEIPAIGACALVEDTIEHRELFGPDGEHVRYFSGTVDMVLRVQELLLQPAERARLATACHLKITGGQNTYADRLREMIGA